MLRSSNGTGAGFIGQAMIRGLTMGGWSIGPRGATSSNVNALAPVHNKTLITRQRRPNNDGTTNWTNNIKDGVQILVGPPFKAIVSGTGGAEAEIPFVGGGYYGGWPTP